MTQALNTTITSLQNLQLLAPSSMPLSLYDTILCTSKCTVKTNNKLIYIVISLTRQPEEQNALEELQNAPFPTTYVTHLDVNILHAGNTSGCMHTIRKLSTLKSENVRLFFWHIFRHIFWFETFPIVLFVFPPKAQYTS